MGRVHAIVGLHGEEFVPFTVDEEQAHDQLAEEAAAARKEATANDTTGLTAKQREFLSKNINDSKLLSALDALTKNA